MSDNNIMGFIPIEKYLKVTYYLLLASAAGGTLLCLFGMLGIMIPLGPLFSLAGLGGLILALLGFFVFKTQFIPIDQSHLMYLSVLGAAYFILATILGQAFVMVPAVMFLVLLAINGSALLLIWTGYNSRKHNRTVTKDNIKDEVQLALKRA